ncbi:unnamed protein product [Strongylus vulgaris]|uniref:Uncharacterized protein n=1 Tax=Strongylus vulgaris TaxID=40348 RepID=A0A3P7III7_STRVU|nr:unnamed protein product [Strongylus vulgaris]
MLTLVGARPQWLMAGFMFTTTFISLWISDTACAALMSPIAYSLFEAMMIHKMNPAHETQGENEVDLELEKFEKWVSIGDNKICHCRENIGHITNA